MGGRQSFFRGCRHSLDLSWKISLSTSAYSRVVTPELPYPCGTCGPSMRAKRPWARGSPTSSSRRGGPAFRATDCLGSEAWRCRSGSKPERPLSATAETSEDEGRREPSSHRGSARPWAPPARSPARLLSPPTGPLLQHRLGVSASSRSRAGRPRGPDSLDAGVRGEPRTDRWARPSRRARA